MSGYGEVVRETPAQAHERKVQAIAAALAKWYPDSSPHKLRRVAMSILAAIEAGF